MDARQAIAANVQLVIEQLGPASEVDFGLNRPSVAWLEGFIERQRVQPHADESFVRRMVDILGSFLGECVAVNAGGTWHWDDEHQTWVVRVAEARFAFPFAKVQKAFDNGLDGGDSILNFYDFAVDHLPTLTPGDDRN